MLIGRSHNGLGIAVAGRRVFGQDGRLEGEGPLPQVLTSWGRLYALLRPTCRRVATTTAPT
jgi:hypothetical protein